MKLTLNTGACYILWTAAIACAVVFTLTHNQAVLIWGIVTVAAAAMTTSMLVGDYIARDAAKYIVDKITAERQATLDRSLSAVREISKAREDRIVSRVQAANEAAFKRVAVEVAEAIMRDEAPTRHLR